MSLFLKPLKSLRTPFLTFQLISVNKYWAKSKKIDPNLPPPGKYDANPTRSFTYSYENITDNLSKSGRTKIKAPYNSKYKRIILKNQYKDFKEKEQKEAAIKSGEVSELIDEEKAKHIIKFLGQYGEENPEQKDKKVEFNLDEILKTKIKKKKLKEFDKIPILDNYPLKEEISLEVKEDTEVFEDPIWKLEQPIDRKYDRIKSKELFWISRNESHYKDSDRRINYLKEFVTPFVIHDADIVSTIQKIKSKTNEKFLMETNQEFQIEKIYQENQEIKELFNQLNVQIRKTHYKQFPNIALSLTFDLRYKVDVFNIWKFLENVIFQNLHHYDLLEISKIHYAMAGVMPKIGSPTFHKACIDLIKQEIKAANIYDVLYIYTSYKMLGKDKLHTFLYKELLIRKDEVCSLLKQDPDLIANLIYTSANCRLPNRYRRLMRAKDEHIEESQKLIDLYLDDLMKGFDKISLESTCRLSLAFTISRVENYLDVLIKIQQKVLSNLDKLDSFLVSNFLYSFSKFSNGRSEGEMKFYAQMADFVEKFWLEFSNKDKARIFYAYTSRGFQQQTCGLIDKLFVPWANENVSSLSYSELSNVIMSLMYIQYINGDFWRKMVINVAKQKYVVPISHYFAFQIARNYISIFYPRWNLKPLEQALYEAGNQFSPFRVPKPTEDEEFLDFYRVLQFKFHINNKPFLEWENLFSIDIAILPQKVGILKQGAMENFQDSYDIRPFYKLKKFILDNKGWKVWVVNWKEYLEQGENKDAWFMKHFDEVYMEQSARFKHKHDEKDEWDVDKYDEFSKFWMNKLGNPPMSEFERKPEKLNARAFTKFGKQGVVKAPAGAAAGKPAAGSPPAAAKKAPAK